MPWSSNMETRMDETHFGHDPQEREGSQQSQESSGNFGHAELASGQKSPSIYVHVPGSQVSQTVRRGVATAPELEPLEEESLYDLLGCGSPDQPSVNGAVVQMRHAMSSPVMGIDPQVGSQIGVFGGETVRRKVDSVAGDVFSLPENIRSDALPHPKHLKRRKHAAKPRERTYPGADVSDHVQKLKRKYADFASKMNSGLEKSRLFTQKKQQDGDSTPSKRVCLGTSHDQRVMLREILGAGNRSSYENTTAREFTNRSMSDITNRSQFQMHPNPSAEQSNWLRSNDCDSGRFSMSNYSSMQHPNPHHWTMDHSTSDSSFHNLYSIDNSRALSQYSIENNRPNNAHKQSDFSPPYVGSQSDIWSRTSLSVSDSLGTSKSFYAEHQRFHSNMDGFTSVHDIVRGRSYRFNNQMEMPPTRPTELPDMPQEALEAPLFNNLSPVVGLGESRFSMPGFDLDEPLRVSTPVKHSYSPHQTAPSRPVYMQDDEDGDIIAEEACISRRLENLFGGQQQEAEM